MELPKNQEEGILADTNAIPWTGPLGDRYGFVERQRATLFSAMLLPVSPNKNF